MKDTERKEGVKNASVAWLLIYAICPFLLFHTFIIGVFLFRNALEIPFLIIFPLMWIGHLRIISYMPFNPFSEKLFKIKKSRKLLSVTGIIEAIMWYSYVVCIYYYYHVKFPEFGNFLNSKVAFSWGDTKPVLWGYISFFVGSIIMSITIATISKPINDLLYQFREQRHILQRLKFAFVLYLFVDLFFSSIIRIVSLNTNQPYSPDITSTIDSFYFSTITLATLGYGDIHPVSEVAKLLSAIEVIVGVFLIAIVISAAISFPYKFNSNDKLADGIEEKES
jgi:hypothetical protein